MHEGEENDYSGAPWREKGDSLENPWVSLGGKDSLWEDFDLGYRQWTHDSDPLALHYGDDTLFHCLSARRLWGKKLHGTAFLSHCVFTSVLLWTKYPTETPSEMKASFGLGFQRDFFSPPWLIR